MNPAWLSALAVGAAIGWSGRRGSRSRLAAVRSDLAPRAVAIGPGSGSGARVAMGLALAVILVTLRVPVPALVVAALVAVTTPRLLRRHRAAAERELVRAATVEVTFGLAGELHAGRTPAQALAAVAATSGPLRQRLDAAGAAVALGGDAAAELARAATLPGADRLRYVAAAWAVAESTGGRVAVVLERLSESMDADDELRRELDAAMAGPRATMVMLGGLPLLGLALGEAVGAHPLRLLLHQPLGWGLLTLAAILDTAGVIATRAIARSALRA